MSERAPAPVRFLHGAGAGGWEWNVWARVFAARGHALAAPDLVPVAAGLAATRFEDYLAQAEAAARAAGSAPVLVGASLGGLLALSVAARVPVAALVLVNPLPPLPEAARLPPPRRHGEVLHWGRDASLAGTRRAVPDADPATWRYAFRRWRDESGAALAQARAGIEVASPDCPVLLFASQGDADVPPALTDALARRLGASLLRVPGGHVSALLGRAAAACAEAAVTWVNGGAGFRAD